MKMTRVAKGRHLFRRYCESLRAKPISNMDLVFVSSFLQESAISLWRNMPVMDQRHSLGVAHRLQKTHSDMERHEIAAALLHDVGKTVTDLGLMGRVVASIVGPRTSRFRMYHDHEHIGAEMCRSVGVDERICLLIEGKGPTESTRRLQSADDL